MRRGTKGNFTKTGIVCLALLLSLGAMGAGYAGWSDTLIIAHTVQSGEFDDPFSWVVSNDDGLPDEVLPYGVIDPGDDGSDPSGPQAVGQLCAREDIDVASTTADLIDQFNITITLSNAYPCYYPTIFYGIENHGDVPAKVVSIQVDENALTDVLDDIPELTVTVTGIYACQTEIDVGQEVIGDLDIHVEQSAAQCTTYTIRVMIVTALYCAVGGTPGYWQNWRAHYTCDEDLTPWLENIDAGSDWLVPDIDGYPGITCHDWDAIRLAGIGGGASAYDRFLMHYCATRLNVEAGRLTTGISLDISDYDPANWLGVSDIHDASPGEVITQIEGKWADHHDGTPLTKQQFNIMKDVCVAFNELGS